MNVITREREVERDSDASPPMLHIYDTGGRPIRPGDVALCGNVRGVSASIDVPVYAHIPGFDDCAVCEHMAGMRSL